jgi:ABC-type amino acid transport substrate-binding protein
VNDNPKPEPFMKHLLQALAITLLCSGASPAQDPVLTIGVASGFPPYQYAIEGQPAGLDVEVARAVAARLGMEPRFVQSDWDSVVGMLRIGRIDIIAGMEVNEFRQAYFDFTRPYVKRHDVVFIRADSPAGKVEDLYGQRVTGDRHSYVELLWRREGIHSHIRITQAATKEEAMRLLAEGRTAAAIMPLEVGRFLARESGVGVKVLVNPDPGSDVAIAVGKGRTRLRDDADAAITGMLEGGQLDAIRRKWLSPPANGRPATLP